MKKIALIIQREYLSRVRKKTFLLVTFLVPLFIMGIYGLTIYLTTKSFSDTKNTVHIIDQSGIIKNELISNKQTTYITVSEHIEREKESILSDKSKAFLLIIPKNVEQSESVELFSSEKAGLSLQGEISRQLSDIIRSKQLKDSGIDVDILETINPEITVLTKEITSEGERESSVGIAMGVAVSLSMLIYLALFLYGAQVMRGIIEEKNNRIIEIIISSVKPFQLMMGKIIGIGLVGLTQFLLWIILSFSLFSIGSMVFLDETSLQTITNLPQPEVMTGSDVQQSEIISKAPGIMGNIQKAVDSLAIEKLLIYFFIFFLGGYLLYSALFAAVGSAVDNETDSQQFMMPITIPLLFTYILSFGVLINDPHGSLAIWLSMIPLTSPIAMLVRIPFGVPDWQIWLSIAFLISGFILSTWVAARIYRVGILMYGKKASLKELLKWFNYKN